MEGKCGSLATPTGDVMVRLVSTAGLEVTLPHAYNSETSQKHVYQLPFMSVLFVASQSSILPGGKGIWQDSSAREEEA
jgi:hypothetical protein